LQPVFRIIAQMNEKNLSQQTLPSDRIVSIDALRGLTILVMIFVNDLGGVGGTPKWMKHYFPYDADGMTFVDVVFPAFLFIVGMAIPFAIGRRLDRGESLASVWKHIFLRTLGLLVIGVFMVNSYSLGKDGVLNPNLWSFLMYAGVILVWNTPPGEQGRKRNLVLALRYVGVVLLILLAFLYRGTDKKELIEMRPHWWGILGLIAWAYLVSCIAYTSLRRQLAGMMGVTSILYCMFMADRAGLFSGVWLDQWVDFGSMLGSLAAITASGVVLGMILAPGSPEKTHGQRIRWAFFYALGMAVAARFLYSLHQKDPTFIINKNAATVPWCLYSSAITVGVWIAIYWLMDVKGWVRWARIIQPAGENPLFAYVLQPMIYATLSILALLWGGFNPHEWLGQGFAIGFWRALVFAFLVTWLTGALKKLGVRLRL